MGAACHFFVFLLFAHGDAGIDEVAFGIGQGDHGASQPVFNRFKLCPAQQKARIVLGAQPLIRQPGQPLLLPDIVARIVQPGAQPLPGVQQGFVRHLDGGFAGGRVIIEAEQAVMAENIEHVFELERVVYR